MSSLNSVLRRYTPPTCTLEISAKPSSLSRWTGGSVLKHLRFKLSFDDPRIREEQWVTISGDRAQLQALCDAVASYVQQFLNQSTDLINSTPNFSDSEGATTSPPQSPTASVTNFSKSTPRPAVNPAGIYLQPNGMTSHELYLGTLANARSGATVNLSAVQLADLASVLDEYASDVTALPNLNRPSWLSAPPAWGKIAAVSLLAIGLTTTVVKLLVDRSAQNSTTATNASQGASSSDQRLAVQPLPPPSLNPSPPSIPTTPLPISSLPPTPGAASPNANSASPSPTAPPALPKIKISEQPPVDAPPPSPPAASNVPSIQVPLREVPVSAIPRQDQKGTTANRPISTIEEPTSPSTTARSTATPSAITRSTTDPSTTARSTTDPSTATPNTADFSTTTPNTANADAQIAAGTGATEQSTPTASSSMRSAAPSPTATLAARPTPASIPQLAEISAFFQQQWKAPRELTEPIQYSLTLAPNGSIERILPVGETADTFLDRTGMPLIGEKFVSPIASGRTATVRVVFSPDGKVQTFLEGE